MKTRLGIIFFFFIVFFTMILGKSFYIQVVNRPNLLAYSKKQTERKRTIKPTRGEIFDRNGNPLAINRKTFNIFINLKRKNLNKNEIQKLVEIIPSIDYKKLISRLEKRKSFTYIKRNLLLKEDDLKKIKKLKTLGLESKLSRFYPNSELAGQLIGFSGRDGDGLAGIEYSFDSFLSGKNKIQHYTKDAKGRIISSNGVINHQGKLYLSIDRSLQEIAEKNLKDVALEFEADGAGIGVMDAETGEVLAVANYPYVDPNNFGKFNFQDQKLNFLTDSFEPGSIIKPLTVASALETGVISSETEIDTEGGQLIIGKDIVKESFSRQFDSMTIEEIIRYSSNVGTSKIAFMLGHEKLMSWFEKFGLGQKANIHYPGEASGKIRSEDRSQIRLSNMGFGQGVTASGLQMLSAYSVFANGGYYVEPTLIKKSNNHKKERVLSTETVNSINKMLTSVVSSGTGRKARMKNFQIIGKTTTAQKVDPNGGYKGYIPGFIGFALNSSRKYVIYTYVDNPKGSSYYGNDVAAPIFKKVMEHLLTQESIAPQLSEVIKPEIRRVKEVKKITEEGKLPSFIGLNKESALNLAEKLNLKIDSLGFGVVSSQSIEADTDLESIEEITLNFTPPDYD